jgi:hypothetical protein
MLDGTFLVIMAKHQSMNNRFVHRDSQYFGTSRDSD